MVNRAYIKGENMKKLMIISETVGGGLRKHLLLLLHHLDLSQFSKIILIHGNRYDEIFEDDISWLKQQGIELIQIPSLVRSLSISDDVNAYRQISKIIKDERPDIVHCHSSKAGIIGRFAAKIHRVPKIFYTPHGYSFQADEFSSMKRWLFVALERLASRLATTMTFTVSKGEKQLAVSKHVDIPDKFDVIYNGLPNLSYDGGNLRSLLNIAKDAIIVGNCARISVEKNVNLFIQIAESFLKLYPQSHFVWIGDGKNLAKYQNVHPNIHFIGFRKDSDELVADFNVFLTTSLHEGLPYAPIEALRVGIPVVASDVAGNNEVVIPGMNGYMYPLNDIKEAVSAIKKALEINTKCVKKDFAERFLLDNMIQKIEKYYLD